MLQKEKSYQIESICNKWIRVFRHYNATIIFMFSIGSFLVLVPILVSSCGYRTTTKIKGKMCGRDSRHT